MGDGTRISWTDATWNPIRGCTRVSEGCRHCYAERTAARFCGPGQPYDGLIKITKGGERRWSGDVRVVHEHITDPMRWKKPRRIFVNSMSDLFHEGLENWEIAAVFGVMAASPQHTFQCLTKRAHEMRDWFAWFESECRENVIDVDDKLHEEMTNQLASYAAHEIGDGSDEDQDRWFWTMKDRIEAAHPTGLKWPLPNVWLGVSTENEETYRTRVPDLLRTPAAVRFISAEPLIGRIEIGHRDFIQDLDWVIVGCESGPGARPMDVEWAQHLRDACWSFDTAFFLKQAMPSIMADGGSVAAGDGSFMKGGVIELPYLDGVQHAAFPEVAS